MKAGALESENNVSDDVRWYVARWEAGVMRLVNSEVHLLSRNMLP